MPTFLRQRVGDLFGVWGETRQIVLVAQTAAMYAAILIPFKVGIPLIPGFAELRPANALPIVASLLFGPVAAWGSGLGNLIGDCFGTLGPASLFGFVGNFVYGYLPHLLWGNLGLLSSGHHPEFRSFRQILEFMLICLTSSLACATIIAWGVDLLGLVPFGILATAIFINNFLMSLLLAPPLLLFLYPRVRRWGLRYDDIRNIRTVQPGRSGLQALHQNSSEPRLSNSLPGPVTPPIVAIQHVSFTYPLSLRPALDDLSLNIQAGCSTAIMGESGAGKSTLLLTLNGLIPQHVAGQWSGSVLVDQTDTRSSSVWNQAGTVGVLFQDFEAHLVSTNIERELAFPLEHSPSHPGFRSLEELRQQIAHTLEQVGLSGLESRNPLALSGGQRQRLAIGTILIRNPRLLALDEPMSDLDPLGRRSLRNILSGLKASGTTLMWVEHDPEEIIEMDRMCIMKDGAVCWDGKPVDLFSSPALRTAYPSLGIGPLPIAACFFDYDLTQYPISVEEAWQAADDLTLTLSPIREETFAPQSHHAVSPSFDPQPPGIIEVRDVEFAYESGQQVLSDINLRIYPGDFAAIVGRNGSGKSTLGTLLSGLHSPQSGSVSVRGEDTRHLSANQLAAMVGFVFQNPDHQIFAETVEEEIAFGLANLHVAREDRQKLVRQAMGAVALDPDSIGGQDPFSLTKGDRQRVAVASVLATQADILIFDEPTTGMDFEKTFRMMDMLKHLHLTGKTIIMITHSLSLVAAYASRCIVMDNGHIQADGPTRHIFSTLLQTEQAERLGLDLPPITRFAWRWGSPLLTVQEIRERFRKA